MGRLIKNSPSITRQMFQVKGKARFSGLVSVKAYIPHPFPQADFMEGEFLMSRMNMGTT
jgi:hypothetical protein